MTYNGIGLSTPRGTGTSGYIERNRAAVGVSTPEIGKKERSVAQISKALADFDERRKIEVQLYMLEKKLKSQEVASNEIEKRVKDLREVLISKGKVAGDNTKKDNTKKPV
jgi:hypothetical protein